VLHTRSNGKHATASINSLTNIPAADQSHKCASCCHLYLAPISWSDGSLETMTLQTTVVSTEPHKRCKSPLRNCHPKPTPYIELPCATCGVWSVSPPYLAHVCPLSMCRMRRRPLWIEKRRRFSERWRRTIADTIRFFPGGMMASPAVLSHRALRVLSAHRGMSLGSQSSQLAGRTAPPS